MTEEKPTVKLWREKYNALNYKFRELLRDKLPDCDLCKIQINNRDDGKCFMDKQSMKFVCLTCYNKILQERESKSKTI